MIVGERGRYSAANFAARIKLVNLIGCELDPSNNRTFLSLRIDNACLGFNHFSGGWLTDRTFRGFAASLFVAVTAAEVDGTAFTTEDVGMESAAKTLSAKVPIYRTCCLALTHDT